MPIKLNPWLQRDMWSTMLTLNPMVLEDTILVSRYLMAMKSNFIKMSNLTMMYSNTMGIRVTMVDHMSLCTVRELLER